MDKELLYIVSNSIITLGKDLVVSYKINIYLPYDPTIQPLGFYQRAMNIHVYKNNHMKMFIAVLLIIA